MIIGIDLGTTNSLVSVWRDGKSHIIPNALGEPLTPSVVGLNEDGEIIVGRSARERLFTHPHLTAANFKRYMGSDRMLSLGNKDFRPEELSAFVLKSLKADAEHWLGAPVHEAIVTVPAYFSDSQRKATKTAGLLAQLKVERLLNEPTAAALAYGMHEKQDTQFLVFDLGGGTFDISVVEHFDGVLQVHASSGDNFLGGEDFTRLIAKDIFAVLGNHMSLENPSDKLKQAIRRKAEWVKQALTHSDTVATEMQWQEQSYPYRLDSARLETLWQPLLERIAKPIRTALRDAKLRASELEQVIMVGGASRMPPVRRLVTKLLGKFPAIDIDPDKAIVVGAGVQAALKAQNSALDDTVLTDVCPYTLGTNTAKATSGGYEDGFYEPIIERNSFVPVSRSQTFYTIADNQTGVDIEVYQGESPFVKDNIFLGKLSLDVPKAPKGEPIDVRFTYDINGLLEVEAMLVNTGKKTAITIEKTPGVMSKQQIQQRLRELEKLKIHPRDREPNQLIMNRAQRLYEELLGEERHVIGDALVQFKHILDQQDDRLIRAAREQLSQLLDRLEQDPLM